MFIFILLILLYIFVIIFTVYIYTKIVEIEEDINTLYDSYSESIEKIIKSRGVYKC